MVAISIVFAFVWIISGVLPGLIAWDALYQERIPIGLVFVSVFGGPVAGLANLFCYWSIKKSRREMEHK